MERGLTKVVKKSLFVDSWRLAEEAVTAIGECLESSAGRTDPYRAYAVLKHCYRHASTQSPNPYYTNMEKVGRDFQPLFSRDDTHPPGLPLATHVELVQVKNATPLEAKVEAAIRCLRPLMAGGHTHLCVEHLKTWLQEVYPGENSQTPPLP